MTRCAPLNCRHDRGTYCQADVLLGLDGEETMRRREAGEIPPCILWSDRPPKPEPPPPPTDAELARRRALCSACSRLVALNAIQIYCRLDICPSASGDAACVKRALALYPDRLLSRRGICDRW